MTPEELGKLLGLDTSELKRTGEQALPRDESARGYAVEPLERMAERLDQEGDVTDVLSEQGAIVQHLQWALGTYFVTRANDRERLEVMSGTFLELGPGELLLSSREHPAVVRVLAAGLPAKVYVLEHGRAEVWSIARATTPRESEEFVVPELQAFTGGAPGAPDVEAEFQSLRSSASPLDRLAAPGLLLRFWVPAEREARQKLLAVMTVQDSPLLLAIRGWYASLSPSTRGHAGELALAEVDALRAALSDLEMTQDEDTVRDLSMRVALGRDRLESARRVLTAAGGGETLTRALRALDDLAAVHLTQFADAGVSDARLRRVLVSEPDAWWAVIGE